MNKDTICNRTVCNNNNAVWFNSSTRAFYCKSCAFKINYWSELDEGVTLCKKIAEEDLQSDEKALQ
jgi:hypothetical protein